MSLSRRGLTLVECLVVIAIIAILIGLLLPATRRVRGAAERSQCQNNLKQLLLGLHNYESQHRTFPPGCLGPTTGDPADRLAWTVGILPFVDQEPLAEKFDMAVSFSANPAAAEPVKLFRCPLAGYSRAPDTTYVGCAGVGADAALLPAKTAGVGVFGYDRLLKLVDIKDGMSNTIALLEVNAPFGPWAQGGFATVRGVEPTTPRTGPHGSLLVVGMADGSVRTVSDTVSAEAFAGAATVAGREPFALD